MAEYVLPPWLRVSAVDKGILGNTAEFSSPLNGAVRTYGRPGDRLRFDVRVENASNRTTVAERAYYEGLLAAIRSKANRVWMSPPGYTGPRGSFPATELFTNADFSNGTTGWTAGDATLTVSNGLARLTAARGGTGPNLLQSVALTAYAPHALRSVIVDGLQSAGLSMGRSTSGGLPASTDYSTARGLGSLLSIPSSGEAASSGRYPLVFGSTSGYSAGAYALLPYASLARCFLTDSGPNDLTRSDEFNDAAWTKTLLTVTANTDVAPDGTTTGDSLTPTAVSGAHHAVESLTISSAAHDRTLCGAFKSNGYTFVRLQIATPTGVVYQVFNLATGALGSTAATGAGWSDRRAFIVALGDGWYYCALVARKTNSDTACDQYVAVESSDSVAAYTGNGSSGIRAWRGTAAASGVPTRLVQTTTTATSGTSQTGAGLYVKGGPASTSGALLPGDYVQIGSQLEMVTAPLDFDAAGLGYLQVSRPMRTAVADNTPIIVHQPMGKFLFADSDIGWSLRPGLLSDFAIPLVEDVT